MTDAPVTITRRTGLGMISLRGDLGSAPLAEAVRAAGGCAVPGQRRIEREGDCAVAWMAPDELLIFLPQDRTAEALRALGDALGDAHHLALDMSDARTVFQLSGAGVREVLAKGAPVPLDPGAFSPGDFRRTRLGQVAVAFWMTAPQDFELMCFRSVAGFVATWLETAARPGSLPGYFPA